MVGLQHFLETPYRQEETRLETNDRTHFWVICKHKGKFDQDWNLHRCGLFFEVGVMLEWQVPMPYTYTGVRALLAQASMFLTMAERGALRGLPSSVAVRMKEVCNGDAQAVRAALGDAMSLNVLMRVLGKALCSAGLLARVPFDPWQQLAKGMSQCDLGSCNPRVLPDSLLPGDGSIVM